MDVVGPLEVLGLAKHDNGSSEYPPFRRPRASVSATLLTIHQPNHSIASLHPTLNSPFHPQALRSVLTATTRRLLSAFPKSTS